jgi:hypothetical protein
MTHEPNLTQHADALRSHLLRVMLLLWELLTKFGLEEHLKDWRVSLLEELRDIRRAQACALVLAAAERLAPPPGQRLNRPPNAPHGCTRSRKRRTRRIVWRVVKAGRGLAGRIRAMRAFHENFDALVARLIARLSRRVPVAAYVMTSAPREACIALAGVAVCAVDDS